MIREYEEMVKKIYNKRCEALGEEENLKEFLRYNRIVHLPGYIQIELNGCDDKDGLFNTLDGVIIPEDCTWLYCEYDDTAYITWGHKEKMEKDLAKALASGEFAPLLAFIIE